MVCFVPSAGDKFGSGSGSDPPCLCWLRGGEDRSLPAVSFGCRRFPGATEPVPSVLRSSWTGHCRSPLPVSSEPGGIRGNFLAELGLPSCCLGSALCSRTLGTDFPGDGGGTGRDGAAATLSALRSILSAARPMSVNNCTEFSPPPVSPPSDALVPPCSGLAVRAASPCCVPIHPQVPSQGFPPPQPPRWPRQGAWRCGCRSGSPSASGTTGSSG